MSSVEPATERYPRPGSLGAELFRHRMDRVHIRFSSLAEVPTGGAFDRLHHFVSRHVGLLDNGRMHQGEASFRPVPERRHFGQFRWFDPERGVIVGAHWPPFKPRAASAALAFPVEGGEDPIERLDELGFPPPESDPTFAFGSVDRPEGATLIYAPAPTGLAELVYRVRRSDDGWDVVVTAEQPPEPRFGELVGELERAFDWTGTLTFPTGEAFREDDGELMPPGTVRLRQVA